MQLILHLFAYCQTGWHNLGDFFYVERGSKLIIAPQNYLSVIGVHTGQHAEGGHYYITPDCTGDVYGTIFNVYGSGSYSIFEVDWISAVLRNRLREVVFIPPNPPAVTLDESWFRYNPDDGCIPNHYSVGQVYKMIPNDPAITGFQNSYAPPLTSKIVVPPSPQ